jgi:hypothetical protein
MIKNIFVVLTLVVVLTLGVMFPLPKSTSFGGSINTISQDFTGGLRSSSKTAGIGYSTGAGCAVTQATNRTTGVTCNGISGSITTNTASLAAEAAAAFVVTNSSVEIGDTIILVQQSGANSGNTDVGVRVVTNGTFTVRVSNNNAAAGTAETGAIILNFAIIKAVSN